MLVLVGIGEEGLYQKAVSQLLAAKQRRPVAASSAIPAVAPRFVTGSLDRDQKASWADKTVTNDEIAFVWLAAKWLEAKWLF
jgi:hypothetical protein